MWQRPLLVVTVLFASVQISVEAEGERQYVYSQPRLCARWSRPTARAFPLNHSETHCAVQILPPATASCIPPLMVIVSRPTHQLGHGLQPLGRLLAHRLVQFPVPPLALAAAIGDHWQIDSRALSTDRHNSAQLATRGQQLCNFWQQWMPGTWVLERSGFGLVWLRSPTSWDG